MLRKHVALIVVASCAGSNSGVLNGPDGENLDVLGADSYEERTSEFAGAEMDAVSVGAEDVAPDWGIAKDMAEAAKDDQGAEIPDYQSLIDQWIQPEDSG